MVARPKREKARMTTGSMSAASRNSSPNVSLSTKSGKRKQNRVMAPVMATVMRMDLWIRDVVLWPFTLAPLKRGNVTVVMAKGIHSTILPSMEQAEYRPGLGGVQETAGQQVVDVGDEHEG